MQINISLKRNTTFSLTLLGQQKLNEVVVTSARPEIENNTEKLVYNVSSSITANGSDALTAVSKVYG